jgi:tyrosine-protein kinase Fer
MISSMKIGNDHRKTSHKNRLLNFIIIPRKSILVEVAKLLDLSSAEEFSKIQEQIANGVKNSATTDEYNDILEKYKASPIVFRFDDSLISDNVGKLLPNQLAVDNLTIDWLKQKMSELEQSTKECQEEQTKIKGGASAEGQTPQIVDLK